MELIKMIENFVNNPENGEKLIELTKVSTDYLSSSFSNSENYKDYLKDIKEKLNHEEGFEDVDPEEFSIGLVKHLYEQRSR